MFSIHFQSTKFNKQWLLEEHFKKVVHFPPFKEMDISKINWSERSSKKDAPIATVLNSIPVYSLLSSFPTLT